ncbi:MAG: HD domain-containing protein [Spirochaetes bacterium]|nr:HD domain-containing protein [Spirochaetota bacterium]
MEERKDFKLSELINSKIITEVYNNVKNFFSDNYDKKSFETIDKAYYLISNLFEGKFSGYKECNTQYHNFNHTIDVFLASMRLIDGYNYINNNKLSKEFAIYILLAALFHDTGYIQEIWDNTGTGAKYTDKHVLRSISFLEKEYKKFNIKSEDVKIIARIIQSTDIENEKNKNHLELEEEKLAYSFLGTADIIGQMADREYLERLLFLYYEFKEAGIPGYKTEFDIIKNTIIFYEKIKIRLIKVFDDAYMYSIYHFKRRYGIQKNLYISEINKNIEYARKILADNTTNFRKKLRRGIFSYINF